MRLSIRGKALHDAAVKLHAVASKGIASEFSYGRRVTITAQPDRVVLSSTNGHLRARLTLTPDQDPWLKISEPGEVTVDSAVLKKLSKSMGAGIGADHIVHLSVNGDHLAVEDPLTSKRGQLVLLDSHHGFSSFEPHGQTYTLETATLRRGIAAVSSYISDLPHKIRYHMICIHFTRDEVRFVCGDGMRFAISSYPWGGSSRQEKDDARYIIPAGQAEIISCLVSDSQRVDLTFSEATRCYVKSNNGVEMILDGIPQERYIRYEENAYRHHEARCVVDVSRDDLKQALSHIETPDPELIERNEIHAVDFDASLSSTELRTDGQLQSSTTLPARSYSLDGTTRFQAYYAWDHLGDLIHL